MDDRTVVVVVDHDGLLADQQDDGTPHRQRGQRFEGRVQQENASLHPGGDGVLVIEVPVDVRRIGMVGDGVQRRATEDDGVFGLG